MTPTRPELRGSFGMVASTHWLASAAGMAMLERGGNAFDAAAAAGFVLQVVEPNQNGLGGDLPVVLYSAERDEVQVVCGQGPAPAAATIERFRDLGLDLVPGTGLLAAVVPGAFDGWMLMLREHGRLPLRTILEPAISYARDGYPVNPYFHATLLEVRELFLDDWPTSAAIYLPGGEVPAPGTRHRNPALAETYARLLAEAEAAGGDRVAQIEAARNAYYRGFVAEAIGRFAAETEAMDSSGRRHRGLLTADDMAGWQARFEAPATCDYHGVTVAKTGPWGQGPVFLQCLALLKGFDVAAMDPTGPEFVHTVVECMKLAYADREVWYGDPDFADVPLEALLGDAYNDARRALVADSASLDFRPGAPGGREPVIGEAVRRAFEGGGDHAGAAAIEPNAAARREGAWAAAEHRSDTVHVDVVDRFGNMVSAMPSGGWMQGSPAIPELGFCLGTRAQMFWLEPGSPSSLAPGKRPRTTLTPGLALRDGRPWLAFGSPGGDGQDQWALQLFLRYVHHGMDLQEAIDAPAFQSSHWPDSFYPRLADPGGLAVEGRFAPDCVAELRRRGHRVEVTGPWELGRLAAVAVGREDDAPFLRAAASPRTGMGYAAGR